jgi:hypothetical protein
MVEDLKVLVVLTAMTVKSLASAAAVTPRKVPPMLVSLA